MKKSILILLLAILLSGCGKYAVLKPTSAPVLGKTVLYFEKTAQKPNHIVEGIVTDEYFLRSVGDGSVKHYVVIDNKITHPAFWVYTRETVKADD
jgi:hypothetical protein